MKKLLNVLSLTLAINFLIVAGFVAWLSHDGHLDRARITAIKEGCIHEWKFMLKAISTATLKREVRLSFRRASQIPAVQFDCPQPFEFNDVSTACDPLFAIDIKGLEPFDRTLREVRVLLNDLEEMLNTQVLEELTALIPQTNVTPLPGGAQSPCTERINA